MPCRAFSFRGTPRNSVKYRGLDGKENHGFRICAEFFGTFWNLFAALSLFCEIIWQVFPNSPDGDFGGFSLPSASGTIKSFASCLSKSASFRAQAGEPAERLNFPGFSPMCWRIHFVVRLAQSVLDEETIILKWANNVYILITDERGKSGG